MSSKGGGLRSYLGSITSGLLDLADEPESDAGGNMGLSPNGRRTSGSIPATSTLAHFSDDFQRVQSENAELQKSVGKPRALPLDLIDDSPYQSTELNSGRVSNLVENLRKNPLSSPIVVRQKPNGRYELVAGRHRTAAYRQLGRPEIECSIRELDDDQAERLVFFDNLLAPSLSDYEKYLGFAARKKSKGLTQEGLAEEAGVSQPWVAKLMAFEKLPPEAILLIQAVPSNIGAACVARLAPLVDSHREQVVEVVKGILEGRISQADAPKLVTRAVKAPVPPAAVERTLIRAGKKKYAELSTRDKRVVIEFLDPAEAAVVAREFAEFLRQRVKDKEA